MKLIYTLTSLSLLGFTALASAEECNSCDKSDKKAKSGDCCSGSCDATASTGTTASYLVTGMTCTSCSDKVKTTLTATEGVTVKSIDHKSGNVVVSYDPAKTDKSKVEAALVSTGFTVAGENLDIPVSGMTCSACSKKVSTALTALEGCTVGTVCHKSGHATVTIDPAKTTEAKVLQAIAATGFKVTEAAN